MNIRIVYENDVDDALDAAIKSILGECFPHNKDKFSKARRWRGNVALYNAVVEADDIVCGHIAVVDRTVTVGNEPLHVAAVANVSVLPEYRGTGLSDIMLKAVMAEAKRGPFDVGLLFTTELIKKVYARNGWIEIKGQKFIRVENEQEILLPPESVQMYYSLKRQHFPAGDVHLRGDKW